MNFAEIFSNNLIQAFSKVIIASVLHILLIAIVWRVLLVLTKRASPATRYNISFTALIAIPVAFTFTLIREISGPGSVATVDPYGLFHRQISSYPEKFTLSIISTGASTFIEKFEILGPLLFWSYLTVVILLSLNSLIAYSGLRSLSKKNIMPLTEYWKSRFTKLALSSGIKSDVQIFLNPDVCVPIISGLLKPVILLPIAIFSSLDVKQADAIMLHELCHIRFRDHHINLILNTVEILFFYHPVTWWICREIRRDREARVDESVVEMTPNPLAYATALLKLETGRIQYPGVAVAAINSKNQLLNRIKNIMEMRRKKINSGRMIAAMLIVITAGISVPWLSSGQNNILQKEVIKEQDPEELKSSGEEMEKATQHINPEEFMEQFRQAREEMRRSMQDINSDEFKEQMRQAREEMEKAIQHLNSEEFMEQFRQAREEMRRSVQDINSDEFKEQMRQAREEMEKAIQHINPEEFMEQFRQAGEEMRRSMQDINSDEFKEQMRQAREEMEKAIQHINPEEFMEQFRQAGEEMRRSMQDINSDEFKEQMRQIQEELRKVLEGIKKKTENLSYYQEYL